jgi:hypothetical protein
VSVRQPGLGQTQPEPGQTEPEPGRTQPKPGRLALIAEATKRAGLIWITVPDAAVPDAAVPGGTGGAAPDRPRAVWHVWRDAAYVLTGPGEQDVPGLGDAPLVTVSVASKDTGGLLVRWAARVSRVEPGSAEWSAIIGALLAGRLNEPEDPGTPSPADRWAQTANVYRLTPDETTETGTPGT